MPRDNFSPQTAQKLGERVGFLCSNPNCRIFTIGAHSSPDKSIKFGRACHIHAASPGGPRFDPLQTSEQRKSITNGIWLCGKHADIIDKDIESHPPNLLLQWKSDTENFVKGNENIPIPPSIILETKEGINPSLLPSKSTTPKDISHYRQIDFSISNPNRTDLRDIIARLQLPEFLAYSPRFKSKFLMRYQIQAENEGVLATGSVEELKPLLSSNWILSIERLSPGAKLEFSALMETNELGSSIFNFDDNDEDLKFFLQGEFNYKYKKQWSRIQWISPFEYDDKARTLKSSPSEMDIGQYSTLVILSSMGPWRLNDGATLTTEF